MNPRRKPNGPMDAFGWAGFLAGGFLLIGLIFGIWIVAEAALFWRSGRDVPHSFYLVRGVVSTVVLMSWAASRVFRERRRHERLAEERSAAYFRSMLDNMTDGAVMMGEDSRINYISPSMEIIFGYSREELLGRDVSVLMPEPHRGAHEGYVHRYLATGEKRILGLKGRELEGVRKSGEVFPLELTVEEIRLEGRRMFVGFIRDLRDKIRLEEERVRRSKLESLSVLAGGIGHDFNNYLGALAGNLSLAKKQAPEGSELHRMLVEAENVSKQAVGLTRQLLTFARGGAPVRKPTDLAPLIEDTVRFALRGKPVAARFTLAGDLLPAEVDAGQIGQVLQNLVINAVQAMRERGTLVVAAENVQIGENEVPSLPAGAHVRITVEDNGTGIPPEQLPKIFDPYFTTKETGSGLGLASALSIVRKHQGDMTVDSQVGKGTTFRIYLPAGRAAAADA